MKKTIMVIALILWGVFFYTQLRAEEDLIKGRNEIQRR